MASAPQALHEAGLSAELLDEGERLVVHDIDMEGCSIRSRGGEALADFLAADRKVRSLSLEQANVTDNGVGQLCLRLRQTDQLEALRLGSVGHAGLSFLTSAVRQCASLHSLSFSVRDVPTLHAGRQSQAPSDFNAAGYKKPPKKEGEEESEGEGGEEEAPEGDDDEEPEVKEAKKLEKLKALFRENDYDSDDEEHGGKMKTHSQVAAPREISAPLRGLLEQFVDAVDKNQNLLMVKCEGEGLPEDLLLDLSRAVARHQDAREKRLRAKEERGARTAKDALRDQLDELKAGIEELEVEISPEDISAIVSGGAAGMSGASRLGVRHFVSRRLFAALGEALFECQRHKSKENEAVSTAEGEMAFIAMYLRKHAAKIEAEAAAASKRK